MDLPKFLEREMEGDYIIWFTLSNQYIQVKKPVWDAVNCIKKANNLNNAATLFCEVYPISMDESITFVSEIIEKFEWMGNAPYNIPKIGEQTHTAIEIPDTYFKEIRYKVGGKVFSIQYPDQKQIENVHPLFWHLESHEKPKIVFKIFKHGNRTWLAKNGEETWNWGKGYTAYLKGRIFMEVLGLLYNKHENDWLTAMHGSAITNGEKTILLTAKSQSGKSTFGALCRAAGYHILSDDYVPVDLESKHVLALPIAHSIRIGSLNTLKKLTDQLEKGGHYKYYERESTKTRFIPSEDFNRLKNIRVPVKAIIFIKYNPETDFQIREMSKLETMRKIFHQAWMPPKEKNVESFLDWINSLKIYYLEYSDATKGMEQVEKLFQEL